MNLGSRLKHILEERGLTVTRFAKEADVPAQTIYALINRDSNKVDMDILIKVLAALDMDFFAFMGADAPAGAVSDTAAASGAPRVVEKVVEKVVVKEVEKEVPAAAPEGKASVLVDAETYEKIVDLAAEEGITDEQVIAQVIDEYLQLGFGYRQKPLRSIFRDMKPRSGRSGDMDSFLL